MSNPFSQLGNWVQETGRNIDPFNPNGYVGGQVAPPTYQKTQYQAPNQSAEQINAMRAVLGATAPEDNRQQAMNSAFTTIDNQGEMARAMSDQSMASRGLYKSGTAGAKLDQINTGLAGQKANATTAINNNYAQNKQGYDLAAMQMALGEGRAANSFNQGENLNAFQFNEQMPYEQRMAMMQQLLQAFQQSANNAAGQVPNSSDLLSIASLGV